MKKTLISICLLAVLPFNVLKVDAAFFAPNDPGVNIGSTLQIANPGFEPSGIVWHNRLQNLFVVGDDGDVAEIDQNGNIIHQPVMVGGDLEGITIANDHSNYLYLLNEYPQQIVEFDISTFRLTGKRWSLLGMQGNAASGAEALTYNSAKGLFYVGSQYDGQIYVYNIDLNTSGSSNFLRVIHTGINNDLAGLSYSRDTERTYAVFDSSNIIQEYNNDDVMVQQYDAPGVDQEGIALLPGCPANTAALVIAQDSGGVLKFNTYPITCPVRPAQNQQSLSFQLVAPIYKFLTSNFLTPGPKTTVKDTMHLYDSNGEYSFVQFPERATDVEYRVDLDARAVTNDTFYNLSVVTTDGVKVTSQSQLINSVDWKNYSYSIVIPAHTMLEFRVVSGVVAGRNLAGVSHEHQLRSLSFTEIQHNGSLLQTLNFK